jgi:hypothetical protein
MTPVEVLLHRASYHAEKLHKRRGNFNSVLWLTEHADGRPEMRETWCDNAPADASDAKILAHLADEMRGEFAASGVARFAVAYLANRVTTSRPVEQTFLMQPATFKRPVVIIEAHGCDEHLRAEREMIELQPQRPAMGAMSGPESAADSIYARLLDGEYAERRVHRCLLCSESD